MSEHVLTLVVPALDAFRESDIAAFVGERVYLDAGDYTWVGRVVFAGPGETVSEEWESPRCSAVELGVGEVTIATSRGTARTGPRVIRTRNLRPALNEAHEAVQRAQQLAYDPMRRARLRTRLRLNRAQGSLIRILTDKHQP